MHVTLQSFWQRAGNQAQQLTSWSWCMVHAVSKLMSNMVSPHSMCESVHSNNADVILLTASIMRPATQQLVMAGGEIVLWYRKRSLVLTDAA